MSYVLIKLTQGQFAKIDPEDEERVRQYKWHANYDKHTKTFYAWTTIKGKRVQMANVIMNHDPMGMSGKYRIDHVNRDTLNNMRVSNLRRISNTQNSINRRRKSNNKSGIIGVCHNKIKYRYIAYWMENKKWKQKCFPYGKKNKDNKKERQKAKKLARNYRLKMINQIPDYIEALSLHKAKTASNLEKIEIFNQIVKALKRRKILDYDYFSRHPKVVVWSRKSLTINNL